MSNTSLKTILMTSLVSVFNLLKSVHISQIHLSLTKHITLFLSTTALIICCAYNLCLQVTPRNTHNYSYLISFFFFFTVFLNTYFSYCSKLV